MTLPNGVQARLVGQVSYAAATRWMPVVGFVLLAGGITPAQGQQTFAAPVAREGTSLDELELANPQPGITLIPPPEKPAEKSPFIHDSKFGGQLRTFYFNRDKYDSSRSEAWTLGGSIAYKSGYLADLFRIGAVAYTSQPLYAPEDRDGTLLLKPGQDGYIVLGQIYGELKFTERIFGALGRKEYNTPYINNDDVRMTPNTFEGVTVYGTAGAKDGAPDWRFGGGYITKIKEKNSDEFVWMSRDAGASVDRGVILAGANFAQKDLSIGAINYYSDDIINIFFTEAKHTLPALAGAYKLSLAAQYIDQRSTGDKLLTGSAFSTRQWGVKADLSLASATLTLAYTDTADGADIRRPWSSNPGYMAAQVQDFNRASESAATLKVSYDFSRDGVPGLSAYALLVHGSGRKAPAFNENEVDLNLQWTPKEGALKGTSFRLRYAHVDQRGGGDPAIDDFRIIVNYDF